MTIWVTIVIAGLLTFAIRLSFIILLGRVEPAPWFRNALRYVPAAVLSAIAAPELLSPGGLVNASLGNSRLLAGGIAIAVAWRTKNVLLTIAAGMAALALLQSLAGG
jgi:branched-subunit amino acid transport protein